MTQLTGSRHGKLEAVSERFKLDKKWFVRCRCDCGAERNVLYGNFIKGLSTSCGCKRAESLREDIALGTRFGKLILLEEVTVSGSRRSFRCQCDCGDTTVVPLKALKNGNTSSCGCLRVLQHTRAPAPIGEVFGRLTVLEESGDLGSDRGMRCLCLCGVIVITRLGNLRTGNTQSCGCLSREISSQLCKNYLSTHGLSKTAFYRRWVGVVARCTDPKHSSYPHYGAKGVQVCSRWMKFENFAEDMLSSFNEHVAQYGIKNTTIDRISSRGHYEPTNCRWATYQVQIRNRSCTRFLEWKGEKRTIDEWAVITGIDRRTLAKRLEDKWSVERMLTEPTHATGPKPANRRGKKSSNPLVG